MTDLRITTRVESGWTVVEVTGEVDYANAPTLRRRLDRLPVHKIILDLRDVPFMDSSALGVLIQARRKACEAGGEVRVVSTSPTVRKIFGLTGLDYVFPIYQTVEAALDHPG